METGDHYYDCLVSRLREETDLRRKAFDKLMLWLLCNATGEVFNKARRIETDLDADIRASENKWIEIQFNRQQADKERR